MSGGSIRLFQFLQKYCRTFGVYPPQPNQNRYHLNSMNWSHLFFLNQFLITSVAFLLFQANSMLEYGIAFYTCLTVFASIIYGLTAFWQAKNISKYVGNWEKFIEERLQLTMAFENANGKIERVTALLAYCWMVPASLSIISALFYTIVNYYILDSAEESFFLNVPAWYPFNWRTPIGYFVAWLSQFTGIIGTIAISASFVSFILGSSLLFKEMAEDITTDLTTFNCNLKTSKVLNLLELMERFCALIQFYLDAKQCVNDFNAICEFLLFSFFSWDLLSIASSLVTLQFQLWDDDSKLVEISFTSCLIFYVFGLIFLICELGERVTTQFEMFGQELERCDWHLLPLELQRLYLIFLSDIQQAAYIRSYGGIRCSRETFKQITNKGFSYFAMLRQFEV